MYQKKPALLLMPKYFPTKLCFRLKKSHYLWAMTSSLAELCLSYKTKLPQCQDYTEAEVDKTLLLVK